MREWVVDEGEDGGRVDLTLVRCVPEISRAKARRAIEEGEVTVNGRRARKGDRVEAGDVLALSAEPRPADFPARPDPALPLVVLHEDAQVLVVEKSAGVPSHPLRADELGTLAGALVARHPELGGVGYRAREPGLVHRLDTGTSGLVLVARDPATFEALAAALRRGEIAKRYQALVAGTPTAPMEVALPLATMKGDTRRVTAAPRRKEDADAPRVTLVLAAERVGGWSLVTVSAARAGRHQIRAHLAAVGFPLAGDALYDGPPVGSLTRHFLHATELAFTHPVTGARVEVRSALAPDLVAALRTARACPPAR